MIKITKKENCITVTGHAGYAQRGKDIVCAGVSVLFQTLIHSIEELTEDRIEYELNLGNASLEFEDLSVEANLLVESFFIGVKDIEHTFSKCVSVIDSNGGGTESAGTEGGKRD